VKSNAEPQKHHNQPPPPHKKETQPPLNKSTTTPPPLSPIPIPILITTPLPPQSPNHYPRVEIPRGFKRSVDFSPAEAFLSPPGSIILFVFGWVLRRGRGGVGSVDLLLLLLYYNCLHGEVLLDGLDAEGSVDFFLRFCLHCWAFAGWA